MKTRILFFTILILNFMIGSSMGQETRELESYEIERFVDNLNNPLLYDIQETSYSNDKNFPMNIHLYKGIGWPQVAVLIIHKPSGSLLMGALISTRDAHLNKVSLTVADMGFLTTGVANGQIVKVESESAGSRFLEAYKRNKKLINRD